MKLKELKDLYSRIDRAVQKLEAKHQNRLRCKRGCTDCCVDDITVFLIEADHIRFHFADFLRSGVPHPKGACAFLDEQGACRIYPHRPYVCRTQGLPLRWLEESDQGIIEYRDICPLNDTGRPVEQLSTDDCWQIGPFEEELAQLQKKHYHNRMERIKLRSLFHAEF